MTIRVSTWHSENFNIHVEFADPGKSLYARYMPDYASKLIAIYRELSIRSAIWALPEGESRSFEQWKPIEYVLEVSEDRVAAYVDTREWDKYLHGERATFVYSTAHKVYDGGTTILIPTPITREEFKIRRP